MSKNKKNAHTTRTCPVMLCRIFRAVAPTVAALRYSRAQERERVRERVRETVVEKKIQVHVILVPILRRITQSYAGLMYCTRQSNNSLSEQEWHWYCLQPKR